MSKTITIRDVAKRAGVSIGTVSRVINNVENVGTDAYQRTIDAIKFLNYKPLKARGLRNKPAQKATTLGNIGVVFVGTAASADIYYEHLRSIEETASSRGFQVIVKYLNMNDVANSLKFLSQSEVHGILLKGAIEVDLIKRIKNQMPVVGLGMYNPALGIPQVTVDDHQAAHEAVNALYDMGHRKIAFINHDLKHPKFFLRASGFMEAAKLKSIYRSEYLIEQNYTTFTREDKLASIDMTRAAELVHSLDPHPTAVICANDLGAAGFCIAMKRHGFRIGDDISVVGFDNTLPLCEILEVPLASVQLPFEQVSRHSTNLLINIIENKNVVSRYVVDMFPCRFIPRKSVVGLTTR
jgi:LacI family transcriptional regulator